MLKNWINAARPKTLPLSVSGILLGSALAKLNGLFSLDVMLSGITTAAFLQILSNFANDYGDFKKGTDSAAVRTDRMMQSGAISSAGMKTALVVLSLLAFISGLIMLHLAGLSFSAKMYGFIALGIASIAVAIKYTVGKSALAYHGLGDIFVFIFFGIVAVCGIFYLHTGVIITEVFLASIGCGLLSVAVLNANNIRDIVSDALSNKNTLVVRVDIKGALAYHRILCWTGVTAILLSFLYHIQTDVNAVSPLEFLMVFGTFSPVFFIFAGHIHRMNALAEKEHSADAVQVSVTDAERRIPYNSELKTISLTTLLITGIYWILTFMYI